MKKPINTQELFDVVPVDELPKGAEFVVNGRQSGRYAGLLVEVRKNPRLYSRLSTAIVEHLYADIEGDRKNGRYLGLTTPSIPVAGSSRSQPSSRALVNRFLTKRDYLYLNLEEKAMVEKLKIFIDSFPQEIQETPAVWNWTPPIKQTPATEGFMINQYHELSKLVSEFDTDTTISKAHAATTKERVEALSNQSKRKKKPSSLLCSLFSIKG